MHEATLPFAMPFCQFEIDFQHTRINARGIGSEWEIEWEGGCVVLAYTPYKKSKGSQPRTRWFIITDDEPGDPDGTI